MTPDQCRRARELLGWTRLDLAIEARCDLAIVESFESRSHPALKPVRFMLRRAFERADLEFIVDACGKSRVKLVGASQGQPDYALASTAAHS